jgi:hypothetical protein
MRVQGIQGVWSQVAEPDITQDRPDNPPDIALVGQPGRDTKISDFKVAVQYQADGGGVLRRPSRIGCR